MGISLHTRDEQATIAVSGRFDFHAHADFRRCSEGALGEPAVRTVAVELAAVGYLDSSALGMLLLLREKAEAAGRRVVLTGARGLVRQVLDVANFGRLFEIR